MITYNHEDYGEVDIAEDLRVRHHLAWDRGSIWIDADPDSTPEVLLTPQQLRSLALEALSVAERIEADRA